VVPPCSDRISRVPPYSRTILCITRTGLSPTKARRSKRFRLSLNCRWPGPRSLATTNGVSVDVLSSRYLDVSVPWVRFETPMYSGSQSFHLTIVSPNTAAARSLGRHRLGITIVGSGFPHSEIFGSKLVRSSPKLIAAYHVLHRLSEPRHPPCALSCFKKFEL
jgi:hypothetical protein